PERAEFVRAQVVLARLSNWDRAAKLLRMRERVLLARRGAAWRAELPAIPNVTWGRFHRGFVAEVSVPDVATLLKAAPAIRAAAPVMSVALSDWELPAKAIPPLPWLRAARFAG